MNAYINAKGFYSLAIGFSLIRGRQKVHDYFLLLLCKSSIWFTEKQIFKIIIYSFNTPKCAANYVILFKVYDGFVGRKVLKLWRQESQPFGPGWATHRPRKCSWTFRFPGLIIPTPQGFSGISWMMHKPRLVSSTF